MFDRDQPLTRHDLGLARRYYNVIQNRREIAVAQFGTARANEVFAAGRRFFMVAGIGPLNALEIAMQVELEFHGRVAEIITEAIRIAGSSGVDVKRALIGILILERSRA